MQRLLLFGLLICFASGAVADTEGPAILPKDSLHVRVWIRPDPTELLATFEWLARRRIMSKRIYGLWLTLAVANSTGELGKTAPQNGDILAARMTAAQIATAQEKATARQASNHKNCD